MGGAGVIVEIDETLLVRRKNSGRRLSQVWVFGSIERESKKKFVVPLVGRGRSADTLILFIKQYIKMGSIICSDGWAGYRNLKDYVYEYLVINHSERPSFPHIHTQNIERLWRAMEEWVRRPDIRSEFIEQYISRLLLIASINTPLHDFFLKAARLYPSQAGNMTSSPTCPSVTVKLIHGGATI